MNRNKIEIRTFSSKPELEIEGWDPNVCSADDYASPRATALYNALGVSTKDEEYALAARPDGRWGLFGMSVAGHKFAVETTSVVHKTLSLTPEIAVLLAREPNASALVEQLLREHYGMSARPTFSKKRRAA